MCNVLFDIINGFLGVVGTGYAVLSILKLKFEDIRSTITWGGIGERDEETLIQREQARGGLMLVFLSWLFESIGSIVNLGNVQEFILLVIIEIIIIFISSFALKKADKKYRQKYMKYKEGK